MVMVGDCFRIAELVVGAFREYRLSLEKPCSFARLWKLEHDHF